ncbi:DUF3817 domain-containing protein [Arthrobacter sp. 35W]|uniref:DUF3817 domain-containing protein n=1 Tax=Arthrobacter sp. 35W TaxID=1132441 RepID=UPI0003FDE676|nr:DUF3817 domain-containing protein [Arthrobacter sp. 35W]
MTNPGISAVGRIFKAIAIIEAFTWAGLLVGMFLKYGTETTEVGVRIFGALHGAAFLIYVAVTILAAIRLRWTWWVALAALAAAVPPLATIPVEMWLRRRGSLSAPPVKDPAGGARPQDQDVSDDGELAKAAGR